MPTANTEQSPKAPGVLITRPLGQHAGFEQQCRALGFEVFLLPCMAIEPVAVSVKHIQQLRNACDITLFTSANAVRFAHLVAPLPWPDTQVHAIGAATANYLQTLGQTVSLTPRAPYSSEAYLEQLQKFTQRQLLIIKGIGGRELIRDQLTRTGWTVSCLEMYKRVPVQYDATYIHELLINQRPDIISVTSNEILANLWQLCHEHRELLRATPLVVNSERCASLARQLGFKPLPLIAHPAGDSGQIRCLQDWLTRSYR